MRKQIFFIIFLFLGVLVNAQPIIDIGLKGGINVSKVRLDISDYNENTITKMHVGAFSRLGWSKIFIQPEVYFSKKGGEFSSDFLDFMGEFDYSTVDVPLLVGVNLFDVKAANVHLLAGPVFGLMTKSDLKGTHDFESQYFRDHYIGLQYGAGFDLLFLTVDFRVEHGNTIYHEPQFDGKNTSFMLSVGFKIL